MRRDLIVPLDGSPFANAVLPHAMELARGTDSRLVLLTVHQPAALYFAGGEPTLVMPKPEWDAETKRMSIEALNATEKEVRRATQVPVVSEFREGAAAEEIVACARERKARAIVCTTHGRGGWSPEWMGSVTDAVVRDSPCPVIALNESATARAPGVKSILVLLDGTAESEAILPEATALAREFDAEVTLMRVVAPEWAGDVLMMLPPSVSDPLGIDAFAAEVKLELDGTASRLREAGLRVKSVVISNPTSIRAILEHIRETDPDLVAAGTSARGISRLFLRSASDKVLRAGGRPTLLLHLRGDAQAPRKAPARKRTRATATAG